MLRAIRWRTCGTCGDRSCKFICHKRESSGFFSEKNLPKPKKGSNLFFEVQIQCGKHHRAPQCAQPRHAGTPHAGGTRVGGADLPSFQCPRAPTAPQGSVPIPPGFPVRIHKAPGSNPEPTPALFFVPFPLVGRAVGCLVRRTGTQPQKGHAGCEFPAPVAEFPASGFVVIRFFYHNCKDALIILANSISRAPALLKQ